MGISYKVGLWSGSGAVSAGRAAAGGSVSVAQLQSGDSLPIEGFGKNVTGGAGYDEYMVTSESDDYNTVGTFSYASHHYHSNKVITFSPDITKARLKGTSSDSYFRDNITIDGFANGRNGIWIDMTSNQYQSLYVKGPGSNVLIRGLNFEGNETWQAPSVTAVDQISLTATSSGDIDGVLIYQCTFNRASDGACDIVGNPSYSYGVKNVTIQQCLFHDVTIPMLIKYGTPYNLSIHHNYFIRCGERHPQARGPVNLLDWVNNVVFLNDANGTWPLDYYCPWYQGDWSDPYGSRFWCSTQPGTDPGPAGNPVVNYRGNCCFGDKSATQIVIDPDADAGGIYWDAEGYGSSNNHWSQAIRKGTVWGDYSHIDWSNWSGGSPKATPNDIASGYEITRHAVSALAGLADQIGCPLRRSNDQTRLDELAEYYPGG